METGIVPHWIDVAAIVYITVCAACCLYIAIDQSRRPAPMMKIMVWVWPINALWAGPLGVWAYRSLGITHSCSAHETMHHSGNTVSTAAMNSMDSMPGMDMSSMHAHHSDATHETMHHSENTVSTAAMNSMDSMPGMDMSSMHAHHSDATHETMHHSENTVSAAAMNSMDSMPGMDMSSMHAHHFTWKNVVTGTLHCGSGCTIADLLGPWIFSLAPFALWNSTTYGEWALDYVLALMIGVFFQYAGLASMSKERGMPLWWRAFKVDVLSLTAWQVGMYGWMGLTVFGLFGPLSPETPTFWLMMQISMACGFITAFPMNWVLIRTGVKSAM